MIVFLQYLYAFILFGGFFIVLGRAFVFSIRALIYLYNVSHRIGGPRKWNS